MKATDLYDEETEQLSDDLVNISGTLVDLTKTAANNFQGVSIFTDASQTEYKSLYTYLQQIAAIYDDLTAQQQQGLLEKLFGKNRAAVGSALIKNFSAAEKAMRDMANSAGSAQAEMETITESVTYKLNALRETSVGVFQNLLDRSSIGSIIDALTNVLEVIDKITEAIGGIPALAGAISAAFSFKNIGRDRMFSLVEICR